MGETTSDSAVLTAAAEVVRLILHDPAPSLARVIAALDQLLAFAPLYKVDTPPVLDRRDDRRPDLRPAIAARFRQAGQYWIVSPLPLDPAPEPMLGDAIDDLSDICSDLDEALWLATQAGEAVGVQQLWHQHQIHWGQHARELALAHHYLASSSD